MTVVDVEAHQRIDKIEARMDRFDRNLRIVNENVSRLILALTDLKPLPLEPDDE